MLCDVWSALITLSSWCTTMGTTCGMYWQPFCVMLTASAGGLASSGAPADTYTTTLSSAFPGPVTTVSVVMGVACCDAQLGSFDISIGFCFAGVPSYVTLPLTLPPLGTANAIADVVSAANTAAYPRFRTMLTPP